MASPHVAGLAALLVEDLGRNPNAIKTRIEESADDLGNYPTHPYYAHGRINVANAVCPPVCCSMEHNGGAVGLFPVAGSDCTDYVHCMPGMMQSMVQQCYHGLIMNPECTWDPNGCCDYAYNYDCPDDKDLCRPGVGADRRA